MKTIKLTKIDRDQSDVLVNWDNVDFVIQASNYFGDKYREIHCGKNSIDVKETLEEIENKVKGYHVDADYSDLQALCSESLNQKE